VLSVDVDDHGRTHAEVGHVVTVVLYLGATVSIAKRHTPAMLAEWPLVGRREELRALSDALSSDAPRSVILVGPAGVGKTRLARESMRLAERADRCAVWIAGTPSVARAPLGALISLLPGGVDLGTADNLPDLLGRSARALLERAAGRRLALFVDDAHLLDDASAGLIHQLVAARSASLVGTVRAGEPTPAALRELWKSDYAERVHLQSLLPQALEDLLTSVLGAQIDPAVTAELATRSQGNVLFFRELVLGALSDGRLHGEDGVWRLSAPPRASERIVELVQARLEGLDAAERALLELVSYGEPLGGAELTALGDPSLADVLEREGLLISSFADRRLQVRLAHPLYGEVLRRATPAVRARAISRSLAETVERTGAQRREDALRVGVWRLDGGGGQSGVMLAAAADARWHYDFGLAERLARAAGDVGGGFDAALLAAQALALQGRPAEAEAELAKLGELDSDAERARLAVARLDMLWLYLGRMDEAQRVAAAAEASISDPALRAEVRGRLAAVLLGSRGPRAAIEVAEPLLAQASGRGLTCVGIIAAFCYGRLGRLQDALDAADRSHVAAASLSEPDDWYPWFGLFGRCEALAMAGEFRAAEQLAAAQYRQGLEEGCREARVWFLWHLARTAHDRGGVQSAAHRAREALTLLRELGRFPIQHTLLAALALALALGGRCEEATRTLEQIDELEGDPPMWTGADLLLARAWTLVAAGKRAKARERLEEAAAFGERVGDLMGAAAALHDIARLGAARRVTERLDALAARLDGELVAQRAAHARALAAGDPHALNASMEAFEAMGADLLAAEAAAGAADAWRAARNSREAAAAEHRAAILAGRCEGATTPALHSVDTRARLTPSEQRAALLAGAGKSNKEIAEELVLSVRTVEGCLYRAYEKLGVSRRAELAAALRAPVPAAAVSGEARFT
jgi:DNA-binding CsgD family transcriptional regulator